MEVALRFKLLTLVTLLTLLTLLKLLYTAKTLACKQYILLGKVRTLLEWADASLRKNSDR